MKDKKLKLGTNYVYRRRNSVYKIIIKVEYAIIFVLVAGVIIGTITQLV